MLILIRHRTAPAPGEMGYRYIHPLPPPVPPSLSPPILSLALPRGDFVPRPPPFLSFGVRFTAPALMHTAKYKCPFARFNLSLEHLMHIYNHKSV